MNFFTVMEHIDYSMHQTDVIKKLTSVYKLKMSTITQGLAMSSFEANIPRFFNGNLAYRVVKHAQSYFSVISGFDDWDAPDNGLKAKMIIELLEFESSHTASISREFAPDLKMYTLAILSLSSSITFANGLINFISYTYKECRPDKFNTQKACSITTRLATRIMLHVVVPRIGAQKMFQTEIPEQVGGAIFWSTICTLDKIQEMIKIGFKESPIVASELVKFLVLNTGFDTIENLVKSNAILKTDVAELKN